MSLVNRLQGPKAMLLSVCRRLCAGLCLIFVFYLAILSLLDVRIQTPRALGIGEIKNLTQAQYDELKLEFDSRRERLRKVCGRPPDYDLVTESGIIYVNEVSKIMICLPSKAGSTNWKRLLVNVSLNGHHQEYLIGDEHNFGRLNEHNYRDFYTYTFEERKHFLQNFRKIITVRHPLVRLASTFRDKIGREEFAYAFCVGSKIKSRYRPDAGILEKMVGVGITWEEFLRFVSEKENYEQERHYAPFSLACDPCDVGYDFVVKLESIDEDLPYIREEVFDNSPGAVMPSAYKHTPTRELLHTYYDSVPEELMKKLYERYAEDFEMFGYEALV